MSQKFLLEHSFINENQHENTPNGNITNINNQATIQTIHENIDSNVDSGSVSPTKKRRNSSVIFDISVELQSELQSQSQTHTQTYSSLSSSEDEEYEIGQLKDSKKRRRHIDK